MKKKKNPAIVILCVILGSILLLPVLAYAYLALLGFGPDKMRADYDSSALYGGNTTYLANGDVTFTLDENELYWVMDQYDLMGQLTQVLGNMATVDSPAVQLKEGGFDLFADATAFGFLPVPLKISCGAAFSSNKITLTVEEARLGKWIKVPLDKLGIEDTFEIDMSELKSEIIAVEFGQDAVAVTERFLSEWIDEPAKDLDALASEICLYALGGDSGDALVNLCSQPGGVSVEELFGAVSAAANPTDAVGDLFAMAATDLTYRLFKELEIYESRYVFPFTADQIAARRAELQTAVAQGQEKYETLLTAAREKYKAMGFTLDATGFLDGETGEPLSLAALCPMSGVKDEESRLTLTFSKDAWVAVKTQDMPNLESVPRTGRKAVDGLYTNMTYDLALVTRMPNGMPAVIYYLAKGTFVVNEVSEEVYSGFMEAERMPVILSDSLEKPPVRTVRAAPAQGLNEFTILILSKE